MSCVLKVTMTGVSRKQFITFADFGPGENDSISYLSLKPGRLLFDLILAAWPEEKK